MKFLLFALILASPLLVMAKNTFRPWKIGMGTNPARSMPAAEPASFETIRGHIVRPKCPKDLKEGMPPPAGPEVVNRKGEESRAGENGMMEKKARRMGMRRLGVAVEE